MNDSTDQAREDDATLVKGIRDSLDRLYHHSYTPLSRGQQWEAGCRELDALAARLRDILKENADLRAADDARKRAATETAIQRSRDE